MRLRLWHGSGEGVRVRGYVCDVWCGKVQHGLGRMYEAVRGCAGGAGVAWRECKCEGQVGEEEQGGA